MRKSSQKPSQLLVIFFFSKLQRLTCLFPNSSLQRSLASKRFSTQKPIKRKSLTTLLLSPHVGSYVYSNAVYFFLFNREFLWSNLNGCW